MIKRILILILSVFLFKGIVIAHPKFIDLDEMIANCKYIFIAKFPGGDYERKKYRLEVERVVKGEIDKKYITVDRCHDGMARLDSNERFLAFINKENELKWAGTSSDLDSGMIYLKGFYDYNFYDISPGGISMVQLKEYLQTGKYSGEIEGNLEFVSYPSLNKEQT